MKRRLLNIGDATSQLIQCFFAPDAEDTNANESLSARSHRCGWWTERVIDALFFLQRNPGHCERADRSDYERALAKVQEYEARHSAQPKGVL